MLWLDEQGNIVRSQKQTFNTKFEWHTSERRIFSKDPDYLHLGILASSTGIVLKDRFHPEVKVSDKIVFLPKHYQKIYSLVFDPANPFRWVGVLKLNGHWPTIEQVYNALRYSGAPPNIRSTRVNSGNHGCWPSEEFNPLTMKFIGT